MKESLLEKIRDLVTERGENPKLNVSITYTELEVYGAATYLRISKFTDAHQLGSS